MTDMFDTRETCAGSSAAERQGPTREVGGATPPPRSLPFDHPDEDFVPEPDPAEAELGPAADPEAAPPLHPAPPAAAGEEAPAWSPDIDALIRRQVRLHASGAMAAFLERRDALDARHGELAATSPDRQPYLIARDAEARLIAAMDRLRGHPDRDTLALARGSVEGAGALLTSLHDAIQLRIAALPAGDGEPA